MDYKKYYKKSIVAKGNNDTTFQLTEKLEDLREIEKVDKYIYLLLLAALLVIPIFIKAHIFEFISPYLTFIGTGNQADIFSYYKYIFLIIITVLLGILFLYKLFILQYEVEKSKFYLFLGLLSIFITLSAIFSPYKSLALHGMYNRHEGTLTFICYLFIFFIAANIKYTEKQLHGFLYILYPFVIINTLFGLLLFNGKNPGEIEWIRNFILASIPEGTTLGEGSTLWATVSNPNYISGIGAVLTVLFLTWSIFDKNKKRAAFNLVVALLSFSMVLTSFSTSGFLTLMVLLPILLILIFFQNQRSKSLVVLFAFILLSTSIFIPMANKDPRVWNETFGFILKENPFVKSQTSLKNNYEIYSELQNPFITKTVFATENGESSDVKFEIPELPERGISAGSGRLYIWEKTIETAMKRPLLGYGLDTYTFVFPQNDIDKVAGLGYYNIVVDKPHNMYLGILIGSGVIALLAFLLLVVTILFNSMKIVWAKKATQATYPALLAVLTATIAYLVQGMFNDSVVGSAIIFWVLLGVLASITKNKDIVRN